MKSGPAPIHTVIRPVESWNPLRADPDESFQYIDLGSVDQENKVITEAKVIRCGDAPSRARQLVRAGDILVSTVRPNLNGVAQVSPDLDGATASTGFCVLRSDLAKVEPRYLMQWVKSPLFIDDMVRKATGASYPAVSDRIVAESLIPLLPLDEQRRIADILDRADALRAKRRAALARLDELTQAILIEMFGDPVSNPKGWPIINLGDHAEIQCGIQVSSSRRSLPVEVPYLRVANVHRGRLDLSEVKHIQVTSSELDRTILKKDDLLVVEGHGNPDEIGRVALWDGSIEPCIHQNHLIRVRPLRHELLPVFACDYLNSPGGRQHLLKSGKSTSGLNTISASEVRSTPLALPPVSLQQLYADRVSAIAAHKKMFTTSLNHLAALFASLQDRAFRGAL